MDSGDVTQLLIDWRQGDREALERLTPLVYDELHRLARSYMGRERQDHTLQATALVNEAYMRMTEQSRVGFRDRSHFVAIAANMMRRVLIDHGRTKKAEKRGGVERPVGLDQAPEPWSKDDQKAYEVAEALEHLEAEDARLARIVELRYFGGMTSEEIAGLLDLSVPTVTRRWALARAWLFRHLGGGTDPGGAVDGR